MGDIESIRTAYRKDLKFSRYRLDDACESQAELFDGWHQRYVDAMAQAIISTLDNPPAAPFLKSAAAPYAVSASATQYLAALGFPG